MGPARTRSGFALAEAMLASAVFAVVALAVFKGVEVAARCAHDQVQCLRADAAAFDLAWSRFQDGYDQLLAECESAQLKPGTVRRTEVEGLDDGTASVRVTKAKGAQLDRSEYLVITVTVEWGSPGNRRQRQLSVVRSNLEREWT